MNQRKLNISRWYALGLAAVLVVACLVVSTGAAWARYRSEEEGSIYFQARKPVQVYLGQVVTSEDGTTSTFQQTSQSGWEIVDDNQMQLEFAIANGTSETEFEERDQQFRIRLIGSLGVWTGASTATIKLTVPDEDDPEKFDEIEAKAVRISAESTLYNTFGDGWVFYFRDNAGEERYWTLEGGELSYRDMDMTLTMDSGTLIDTSLLQLQIIGELAED